MGVSPMIPSPRTSARGSRAGRPCHVPHAPMRVSTPGTERNPWGGSCMNDQASLHELELRIRDVSLDLDPEAMRRAAHRVADYVVDRMVNLRESTLGQELHREETEALLREPLPEGPMDFDDVFAKFARDVAPYSIALDHPRFWNP
jgi:hypothetical protein